jgi:hypothetical protein
VAGLGDDAVPIPARAWRLSVGGAWDQWDRRLLPDGARAPWLQGLNTESFGVAQLPALAEAESGLRGLLDDGSFALTLGPLEGRGAVRRATSVLSVDYGVSRRFSIGLRVPYVEVVHDARLVLNRDGTGANVGRNPAFVTQGGGIANQGVHFRLTTDGEALAQAIGSCTASDASALCEAIRADPAAAQALTERAAAFAAEWRRVYGADGVPGAPVIPVAGSAEHNAISARLAALSDDFARYGFTNVQRAVPNGAQLVFGTAGLQELAQDSAFGLLADTLGGGFRAGMGDVDLEVRALLFDTWRGDQAARLTSGRSGLRLLASGGWRFGTASSAQANEPFALALGDGVNALLLRLTADAVWRRRAWLSVTARYTAPLADQAVVRLPGAGDPEAFFLGRPVAVDRALAPRLDLEVAPRLNLGEHFGLSATLSHRQLGGDVFTTADGARFVTPSGSAQFGAIGVSYSTLAPFTRGKSRRAIEVLFAHEVALSTSGLSVPSLVRDRIELRVFRGFPTR